MIFEDREAAGRALGLELASHANQDVVVLALPRGGVPIGKAVATLIGAPMDLAISRKVGHPMQPEYAIGAVTEDGGAALNELECSTVSKDWLDKEIQRQIEVAREYRNKYWRGRPRIPIEGKTVILVDDGVATGYTMLAAIRSMRSQNAKRIVVASPVAAPNTRDRLCHEADECVFLETPEDFRAVGYFYRDFLPVQDEEIVRLLAA